jgi:excisionase family DNA binding protein
MESNIENPKHLRVAQHEIEPEFLTTAEVAARLRWSVRTIRAKIAAGVLRRDEHYFQPTGCQYRWKWSAVVAWVEGGRNIVAGRTTSLTAGL